MSDDLPAGSPWLAARAAAQSAAPVFPPDAGDATVRPSPARDIRHAYPLMVRDHSLSTATSLVARTLPYALARFAVLLASSIAAVVWAVVTIGGAAWLGTHVAAAFGWVWALGCLAGAGFVWGTLLRYALHLIACGHVAVLTDLITRGAVGSGAEGQFAYGRRVVTERFGQVTALFGLNAVVRGILQAFHRTLDWIEELLPIPGLDAVGRILSAVLQAATRYLDKAILSYNLARGGDPWAGARDGIVYYCQNAKPILKTSVLIVVLEYALTALLWLLLLAPAAAITVLLPASVREAGGLVTVLVAALLAATLRAAFVKPLFLAMILVRFHALIEGQPIHAEWAGRLEQLSDKFRSLRPASAHAG